jgi:hypothetical protein
MKGNLESCGPNADFVAFVEQASKLLFDELHFFIGEMIREL